MVETHIFHFLSTATSSASNTLDIPFIFLLPGMKTMKIVMHCHLTMKEKGCCEYGTVACPTRLLHYSTLSPPLAESRKVKLYFCSNFLLQMEIGNSKLNDSSFSSVVSLNCSLSLCCLIANYFSIDITFRCFRNIE